ncbi:MAG TPA: crossover junction endodeoxyribonuclease RuvC [Tepidisphaeraceae bacterium]|jgi:crossover junction endodeoxyribonuclease RuvC|nr:crossover junction endodeoxyribonuclease RuvC [Tepidisphaeraceae bacterium]
MRVLGIDPGLQLTGYGVIESHPFRPRLIDGGVIRLAAKTPIASRLVELERALEEIVVEHRPERVAVEMLYAHYNHPRTAILMAHARGVILLVAARHGLSIDELPANRVKQAVSGHGHASKHQMQRAIQSIFSLKDPPEPPDVADALAIAICSGMSLPMDTASSRPLPLPAE